MSVIYVLIPIAIILTIVGIYLFFWAVKTEQFNDLEKEGLSILFDDESKQQASDKHAGAQEKPIDAQKSHIEVVENTAQQSEKTTINGDSTNK
ncbi:cbb3-type cytochrome oxidase assembly protein CcoS [Colwellia sp. MEBiC06753]